MNIRLLSALNIYYQQVIQATRDPSKKAPTEVKFPQAPEHDLESMIWVLTYAIFSTHKKHFRPLREPTIRRISWMHTLERPRTRD